MEIRKAATSEAVASPPGFDHRSHSVIYLLFTFKSVDDVGTGKLREMLTLHTNPHAVYGRFTLKDDCER